MKTTIAIDAGAAGGIAWQFPNLATRCAPMPKTATDVCLLLKSIIDLSPSGYVVTVFLEQLVKHMGHGIPASTMAVYASSWGTIQGAALYAGCRLELVTPQKWQKELGLGITGRQKADRDASEDSKKKIRLLNGQLKRDWKNKLKDTAQRLYPALADQITLGTADAVLILEYGLRKSV